MPFENGEHWRPLAPDKRGRHPTFASAVDAAISELMIPRGGFLDVVCDEWRRLFPNLPARPGRYAGGVLFVYVRSSADMFVLRPRLKAISARLAAIPGSPARLKLRLEVHS